MILFFFGAARFATDPFEIVLGWAGLLGVGRADLRLEDVDEALRDRVDDADEHARGLVEEAEQLAQLKGENCDVGQGYLFARPLAPEEVEAFFDRPPPSSHV